MQKIVTETQRKRMRKHFRDLINSIQAFQLFPRKVRNMLAERLLDVAVAEEEEKTPPEFPPEGFEVVFTKIGSGNEKIAATLSRRDNNSVGPVVEEQSKMDVPVESKL